MTAVTKVAVMEQPAEEEEDLDLNDAEI